MRPVKVKYIACEVGNSARRGSAEGVDVECDMYEHIVINVIKSPSKLVTRHALLTVDFVSPQYKDNAILGSDD